MRSGEKEKTGKKEKVIEKKNLSFSDIPFLKINGQKSFNFFDEESIISLKLSLYTTLASIEEEVIGREINKLFDKLFPNEDPFKVNLKLTKDYYDKYYVSANCEYRLIEDLKTSLDSIINKNYQMEFFFFQSQVEELCKVLVYSYLDLSNYYLISFNKTYKVNSHKEFMKVLTKIMDRNVDVIKRYRDKERDISSVCSRSTRSSFSSAGTFSYKYSTNANEFEIPTEMIILLNKFQTIKKLKMFVPNKVEDLLPFIIILLNVEWLFPNLFEVELDITNGALQKDLIDQFIYTVEQKKTNPSNYGRTSVSRKNIMMSHPNTDVYLSLIKENKNNFDLIVIYSYFLSRLDKIKFLNLVFPDSFQNEIIEALKLSDVNLLNFQFLNFLTPLSNLFNLSVEFDSLDNISFEKVLSLFHKNNYMKCFKLNLFPEDGNITPDSLIKLCSILNINTEKFLVKKKSFTNSVYDSSELNTEVNDYILLRLLDNFQENLEKFFFILQSKMNLCEFHLKADIPRIISTNENYIATFHKLILNLLILLNSENCCFQTLKIIIPFLPFDNRKYPNLGKFFEMINLKHKNKSLFNLTISLQFYKVLNLSNIISLHLKFLHLGELDCDTFSSFMNLFKNDPDYRKNSQLVCLQISLSNVLFDSKLIISDLLEFLKHNKPNNLREFTLLTCLLPSAEDLIKLFHTIKYDRIEKYVFEFNKRSIEVYNSIKLKLPVLYYYIDNKKLNLRVVRILSSLGKKLLHKKIFTNVRDYLQSFEKKSYSVVFK